MSSRAAKERALGGRLRRYLAHADVRDVRVDSSQRVVTLRTTADVNLKLEFDYSGVFKGIRVARPGLGALTDSSVAFPATRRGRAALSIAARVMEHERLITLCAQSIAFARDDDRTVDDIDRDA